MNSLIGRAPAKLLLSLGCIGSVLSLLASPAGADEVVELPPVGVSANVPLVKVADFQMLRPRAHAAAVTDGRYIYIIGGTTGAADEARLASIERFDPATGGSEEFAQLRHPRIWHGAALYGGKIYVMGGINQTSAVESSVEIVDLATRQVSLGAKMLAPKEQFGCVVVGDDLYVLGGMTDLFPKKEVTNSVGVYSFATGTWRRSLPLPSARLTGAAVFEHPLSVPTPVSALSPDMDLRAAMRGGPWIVAAGGYDGIPLDKVEVFSPRSQAWFRLPPLCKAVSAYSAAVMGHYLFLFGNYANPSELVAYNLFTKKSEAFSLRYKAARHTAAAIVQGKIYVIGGRVSATSIPVNYIQVFAPTPEAARELSDP